MHPPGVLSVIFLISLLSSDLINALQNEPTRRLEKKSSVDLAVELDERSARLWDPQISTSEQPDHLIFRHYPLPNFNLDSLKSSRRQFDENFSWSSISLLSLSRYNLSYILLGGSWSKNVDTPYPREDGIVLLCNFSLAESGQLKFSFPCHDLSEGLEHTSYLGATSASLQISPSMGLLAYCDPLWRDESQFPAGRCYLQLLHNKNVRPRHELASFCKAGGKVTEPCMTGFSIDLLTKGSANPSFVDFLKSIHVVVGQPLAKGCGQAEILADPFYFPRTYTAYRPNTPQNTLPESYFGYSVAGEYISDVGQSFKTSKEGNSESHLTQLFKIGHLDGVLTAGGVEFDWQGQIDKEDSFTGFGTSMINVKNIGGQDAVIVGAPYAAKGGRVYLYCIPNNLAVNNNDDRRSVPTQNYNDFISAQEENDTLGYSLTALGDIDGDGRETIAIGSPNLRDKEKSGRVYIVRILPNCTFDRRPVQVIQGPDKATYFGSVLPRRGMDLDFNNWPDLALPVPYCTSCSPMIYASRPHYQAVCRFYQPNWLNSVRIRRNIPIPIKLKIRLIPSKKTEGKNILQLLQSANVTVKDLVHQIIPDLWAKDPVEQRIRLSSFSSLKLNRYNNVLSLKFDLLPQMDVEDIPSLGQPDGDIRIQYRFNIPCPSNAKPIENTNICSNGAWVNRPRIDWSKCSFQLRLTKFICLPKGRCESDVFLRVTDEKSGKSVESESTTPTEETVLIYGDKENAFSKLSLDVFNKGPTFAGGVWIKMAFYGNLRFSALEVERREGNNGSTQFKPFVCSHSQNNDSWVACNLGRLEFDPVAASEPAKRIRLITFFVTNSNIDYSLPTYVNISVSSQTYDPQAQKNFVIWNYRLQHAPKYLITPGTHAPSSVIDNRTAPIIIGPSFHHRILVDEMGPRIQHTFRLEYMGPTKYLENVTLRLYVPVKLEDKPKPLVYLFNEVRAPLANGIDMEWVSLRPEVKLTSAFDGVNDAFRCWYSDESLVNPNGWIGIDLYDRAVRRSRRELPASMATQTFDLLEWDYVGNYSNTIDAAAGRFNGKYNYQKVSLRRIPKEVIQCGRRGHKFGKPVCVEIYCRLNNLYQKRPVQVTVKGWLYAPTFFQYSTSDVEIVTSLTVDQGAVPKGVLRSPEPAGVFHMPQVFYFTKIKQAIFYLIPVWPIVVGLVLGILLLTLLVLLLYRFGFFRRRKHKLAVSGRRRWHENMENEATKRDADGQNGIDEDLDTFGSIRYAEEARKRRLRLRKHPEVVSILHPNEIRRETEMQGQDNPVVEMEPPTMHEGNGTVDAISPAPPQQQPSQELITNNKPAADTMKVVGD
nr:integrin alpha ps [Hymenolepis microstoma]